MRARAGIVRQAVRYGRHARVCIAQACITQVCIAFADGCGAMRCRRGHLRCGRVDRYWGRSSDWYRRSGCRGRATKPRSGARGHAYAVLRVMADGRVQRRAEYYRSNASGEVLYTLASTSTKRRKTSLFQFEQPSAISSGRPAPQQTRPAS